MNYNNNKSVVIVIKILLYVLSVNIYQHIIIKKRKVSIDGSIDDRTVSSTSTNDISNNCINNIDLGEQDSLGGLSNNNNNNIDKSLGKKSHPDYDHDNIHHDHQQHDHQDHDDDIDVDVIDNNNHPYLLTTLNRTLSITEPLLQRISKTIYSNIIIIGIAGGSGSGKTTLTKAIYESIGKNNIIYISHDIYLS